VSSARGKHPDLPPCGPWTPAFAGATDPAGASGPEGSRLRKARVARRRRFALDFDHPIVVGRRNGARALEAEGRVVFRYVGFNPNGSRRDIAGISNAAGNVVGLMPHPEHAVEPGFGPESLDGIGGSDTDGLGFFTSVLNKIVGGDK